MKIISKHNLLDAFIQAYDEELFSLSSSSKLLYVPSVKDTSKDNYEEIKKQVNDIPNWLSVMYQFKNIVLDEDIGEIYMKFEYGSNFDENGRPIDFSSIFEFYDKNDNEICVVELPSILAIVHGKLHEDLIVFKVVKEVNGEIIGLKNKYNNEKYLSITNKTYKYIESIYKKVGRDNAIEIRHICLHNQFKFNMLKSIEDYYNGCLCARMFHSVEKIPLVRSLNESELEYSKRFFKKHGISNCNINLILDNFKNIYLYLKELHDINVYQSFFADNYRDYSNLIYTNPRLLIELEEVQMVFSFFIDECTTLENFESQNTFFGDYSNENFDEIFTVGDLINNKKEMLDYIKTISY